MSKSLGSFKLGALERFATSFHADFRFGPLNIMILVVLCLLGLTIHLSVFPFRLQVVITMVGIALILSVLFRLSQIWRRYLCSPPWPHCGPT